MSTNNTDDTQIKSIRVSDDTHSKIKILAAMNRLTMDEMVQAMNYLWVYSELNRKEEMVKMVVGEVV